MKNIGLAVVGSGFIARKVLKDIADICDIVCVYSRNEESAQALAQKYGARQCAAFEEVLADETVDCIYISTPHTSHCRYASLALRAGKPVICEKPAAMNQQQLEQMLALSDSGHAYFSEIMHFRHSPVFSHLREILESQAYGKLKKVYADIGFDAFALPKRKRLLNQDAGGGALLDIGIYIAVLADFIFGDVTAQQCSLHVEKTEDGVDVEDHLFAEINGVSCEFLCSLKRVLPSAAVLTFERGLVEIPVFFKPNQLLLKDETSTEIVKKDKFCFRVQFQRAFDDIREGHMESKAYDHAASYRTVCLLDAVRKHGGITYAPELEKIEALG